MEIESAMEIKKFKPFKIVIQTQEEVEHLLYILCTTKCPRDPEGIQAQMRQFISDEVERQKLVTGGYMDRQVALYDEFIPNRK